MTGDRTTDGSTKARWLAVGLAAITFALYLPTIRYDFVDYDDWLYVVKNQAVLGGLSPESLAYACRSLDGGSWMPLTWLSLLLDVSLFGAGPAGFHFTNTLLHALTCGCLLLGLHRLTHKPWLSLAAVALFALHPLRTESVAWIAERKDVLSGLLFALTLLAYARYTQRPSARRMGWVALGLMLGLMAKPMLVTVPFVLLLLDLWPLRRMGTGWRELRAKLIPLVREKAVLFVLVLLSCVATYWAQKHAGAISRGAPTLWGQAGDIVANYSFYLSKLALPVDRTVIYPQHHLSCWALLLLAAGLSGFTGFVMAKAFRWPWLTVGWLWFLGMLAPVIGIVPVGMTPVADRYTYLPSIGLGIAIVWSVAAIIRDRAGAGRVAAGLAVVGVAGLGLMTFLDLSRWQDSRVLFESALRVAPHKIAYNNLAYYCIRQGDFDRAVELSDQAIALDPAYGPSYSSRAMAYVCRDDYARAKRDYDQGIRLGDRPLRSLPNYTPGLIAGTDPEHDWEEFTAAIGFEPRSADDFLVRAESRLKRKATALAIADFTKCIEMATATAAAYYGRGCAYNLAGDASAALRDASQAIALSPTYADAYATRAVAQTRLGNYAAALENNNQFIALSPTNALGYQNRAVSHFLMKNFGPAWQDVARCRELGGQPHESFIHALSEASGPVR